jgi:hypothetical protein
MAEFSRRTMLGSGAVLGAVALAEGVSPARAVARPAPSAAPVSEQLSPSANAPKVRYQMFPGPALVPAGESGGVVGVQYVAALSGACATPAADLNLLGTTINLPDGSILQTVTFYMNRTGGAQPRCAVDRFVPAGGGYTDSPFLQTVTATGLVTVVANLPRVLDNSTEVLHALVHNTSSTAVVRGIRIGYIPPTSGVVAIDPRRVYDSRASGGQLIPDQERTISVATDTGGNAVVPAGASGAILTVTITETEADAGYVSVFPAVSAWPGTSSINWFGGGQNLATTVVVGLGGDRQLTLRAGVRKTVIIVEVTGYLI